MRRSVDTVVIGAGISGLAYAFARGADEGALVLEASDRPGGMIRTLRGGRAGEFRFEAGAEALQTGSPALEALLAGAGLAPKRAAPEARKRFLAAGGRLHEVPSKLDLLLASPLLSASGKARALLEPMRSSRKALEGSIADFARHRFGAEVLDVFVDAFVTGIHAGDPEELSLPACFPEVAEMVRRHGSILSALRKREAAPPGLAGGLAVLEGGMEALPLALARSLGPRLALSRPVRSVQRLREGWVAATDEEECEAARVVVALPAAEAARLLADCVPSVAGELASIPRESLAVVAHAWRREQVGHPLDGFGYLVPHRQGLRHLGTLFSSTIDPSCAPGGFVLLRTLIGGARRAELAGAAEKDLLEIVEREVGALLAIRGEPQWARVVRWREALPRYDLDHPRRLEAIDRALPEAPGLHLLGNHLCGIGIPALVASAQALAREHSGAG